MIILCLLPCLCYFEGATEFQPHGPARRRRISGIARRRSTLPRAYAAPHKSAKFSLPRFLIDTEDDVLARPSLVESTIK